MGGGKAPRGAGGARRRSPEGFAEVELKITEFRQARSGTTSSSSRSSGQNIHDLERRHLRLAALDAGNPSTRHQSGILGLHAIQDRPIALNGQDVIRPDRWLHRAHLRSPPGRRPRGGDVLEAHQASASKPRRRMPARGGSGDGLAGAKAAGSTCRAKKAGKSRPVRPPNIRSRILDEL